MSFYNNFKLGVLGGGQLGKMLMQPCQNFGVHTLMMDPDPDAPCKKIATEFFNGDIRDFQSVLDFGRKVDVLTIEIENVNVEALFQLEKEGVKVFPQPRVIEIIKDKRIQKQFYKEQGIPTPDFVLVDSKEEITNHASFLPAFQKLGTGGYDGGGVQKIKSLADLDKAFDAPSLLEEFIDFQTEISVIVARNENGEVKSFPVVECVFHPEYNLVDYLIAPAQVSDAIKTKAYEIAETVIKTLDMVGILAVEMFVTKQGDVLVNEVAPRPHNSGHQTINANLISQYEQHLRAILNLPLGATDIIIPSAMVNLLGEDGYTGEAVYDGLDDVLALSGINLLLYGKKITKPHRKMGHITVTDTDINRLKEKIAFIKDKIKIIS